MTEPDEIVGHRIDQTLFTHTVLYFAAQAALEEGRSTQNRGKFMVAQVMAAFAFEAYLNYAGESLFPFWAEIEKIPAKAKLATICKQLGYFPKYGERPYQTIADLQRLRNTLAHARTESLSEVKAGPPPEPMDYPQPEWAKACVLDRSQVALIDVKAVADDLHQRAKLPFGAMGHLSIRGAQIARKQRPDEKPQSQ